MISSIQLAALNRLIDAGAQDRFYHWAVWERLRAEVLRMDHYECQLCKKRGKYSKAAVVHHVKHLKDRPDLALSIWDGEQRQLISLCKACHEEQHPERVAKWQRKAAGQPVTQECWD